MIIGILKEPGDENRVALLPESVASLVQLKVDVRLEKGAGESAFVSDQAYEEAGAKITTRDDILTASKLIVGINPPTSDEINKIPSGTVLLAVLEPLTNNSLVHQLLEKELSGFSLDSIPRTTRAQAMDVLSSMATVAGYKAVLMAADHLSKFFPMFMTAAGSIIPAKVLILGAGVAGLQAIATARKLGAVVEAFDVRAAVKEEVESLGAKFVEVEGAKDEASAGGYAVEQTEEFKQKQRQVIEDHVAKSDVVITTAQIPGREAPRLISTKAVEQMKAGSVIVDLAAVSGGNCELTKNNETIRHQGVTIIGNSNLPSGMPFDASKMFGKNVVNFLKLIIDPEGELNLNFEDDIVKGTCITHQKEIVNERVKNAFAQKV